MSNTLFLRGLIPFISNPVVLAIVGVGAAGYTIYELLSDKKEKEDSGSETVPDGSEPPLEPLNDGDLAVFATVTKPLEPVESTVEEAVNPADEEPCTTKAVDDCNDSLQRSEIINDEDLKKEVIRQAMSELGKRSAAARAKKKLQS